MLASGTKRIYFDGWGVFFSIACFNSDLIADEEVK